MARVTFKLPSNPDGKELEKFLVWSAKGGVGKTTVSIAIANKLSEKETTGILDADITCPNVFDYLNIEEQLVGNREKNVIYPVKKGNLEIISMGGIVREDLPWRGVMLSKAVEDFIKRVEWRAKRIVIDAPPGTSDVLLTLVNRGIKKAVLVTTPSKLALRDLKRSVSFLKRFNISIAGVVENMVPEFSESIGKEIEKEGLRVLCSIKLSKEISDSIEKGESIDKVVPCFEKIARELLE